MTDQAAYRRYTAEAERLMEAAGEYSAHDGEKVALVQRATVWAALALAAAQERVQPANRPTELQTCPTCESIDPGRRLTLLVGLRLCTDPWHDLTPISQP